MSVLVRDDRSADSCLLRVCVSAAAADGGVFEDDDGDESSDDCDCLAAC